MSDIKIPDKVISIKLPRKNGNIRTKFTKAVKVEMFGAYQFKSKHKRLGGRFVNKVPMDKLEKEAWFKNMYRLRIDGKFHSPAKGKGSYEFFNVEQVALIVASLI